MEMEIWLFRVGNWNLRQFGIAVVWLFGGNR